MSENWTNVSYSKAGMKNRTIDELLILLQDGIQSILDGKQYKDYLKAMAHFPDYSARNTLLIFKQMPEATMVAGYQTWSKVFGRYVKKGEKGIRILAPYTYRVPDKEDPSRMEQRTGFRSISVFDVSQTEGKPLPQPPIPEKLTGEFTLLEAMLPTLERLSLQMIQFRELPEGMNGRCRYDDYTIDISNTLEPAHAMKTLLHECAHALLHDFAHPRPDGLYLEDGPFKELLQEHSELREVEAESVSFIVGTRLGLDCSDYAFRYIARWMGSRDLLTQSLERIARISRHMLKAFEDDGLIEPTEKIIPAMPSPSASVPVISMPSSRQQVSYSADFQRDTCNMSNPNRRNCS